MKNNLMYLKALKNNSYLYICKINTTFILLYILFVNMACGYIKYGKAIQNDINRIMLEHKEFLKNSQFKGKIFNKLNCQKCEINRFVLMLKLDSLSIKPQIGESSYHPYYVFIGDSFLQLSVLQSFFDKVKLGDPVLKNNDMGNIIVGKKEYEIISKEENKWFPD